MLDSVASGFAALLRVRLEAVVLAVVLAVVVLRRRVVLRGFGVPGVSGGVGVSDVVITAFSAFLQTSFCERCPISQAQAVRAIHKAADLLKRDENLALRLRS